MTPDPAELADLAVDIAADAGRLLLDGLRRGRTLVETKSSATDMVTEMDRASEALVGRRLLDARPDDALVGEEGVDRPGTTGVQWIVDPLDGTTNYLYGFLGFAVSIAAAYEGEVVAGAVHDPIHGETFRAVRGGGATLDGAPLRITPPATLATALVGTGFSYDADRRRHQAQALVDVLPRVRDIRRAGAAALDTCWVAAGRLDAYYEHGLQPWDWAAGALVAAEAGARTEIVGHAMHVAAPPHLFDELVSLLDLDLR